MAIIYGDASQADTALHYYTNVIFDHLDLNATACDVMIYVT